MATGTKFSQIQSAPSNFTTGDSLLGVRGTNDFLFSPTQIPAQAAGSNTQLQYNNSGLMAGMSGTTWDDTNRTLNLTAPTINDAAINMGYLFSNGGSAFLHAHPTDEPSLGPFSVAVTGAVFNAQADPVLGIGYNCDASSTTFTPYVGTEPMLMLAIEGHFLTGGKHLMEMYYEYFNVGGTQIIRPWGMQIDRNAATVNDALWSNTWLGNPLVFALPDGTITGSIGTNAPGPSGGVIGSQFYGDFLAVHNRPSVDSVVAFQISNDVQSYAAQMRLAGGARSTLQIGGSIAGFNTITDIYIGTDVTGALVKSYIYMTQTSGSVVLPSGGTFSMTGGSVHVGNGALGTSATDGFLYIPTCAGAPAGTPTAVTGLIPMIYDTTNHQFWFYDSGWKQPKTPAGAAIVTWQ